MGVSGINMCSKDILTNERKEGLAKGLQEHTDSDTNGNIFQLQKFSAANTSCWRPVPEPRPVTSRLLTHMPVFESTFSVVRNPGPKAVRSVETNMNGV